MNQVDAVLKYVEDNGSITSMQAFSDLGIVKLSNRICELKDRGVPIASRTECGKNRYGTKTHWKVYYIEDM